MGMPRVAPQHNKNEQNNKCRDCAYFRTPKCGHPPDLVLPSDITCLEFFPFATRAAIDRRSQADRRDYEQFLEELL